MATDEYEILLWLLGDRVVYFNMLTAFLMAGWVSILLVQESVSRVLGYLDYRLDFNFWNEML